MMLKIKKIMMLKIRTNELMIRNSDTEDKKL